MMIDEELDGMRALIAIKDPGRFGFAGKLLAHIDERAKQITALKAALITERAKQKTGEVFWNMTPVDIQSMYLENAKKQLAQEYPGIEWEEKK